MTLFKYIRPERIDMIENLEIRFTQPDALNDPFELHPHFESIVAEADVLANLPQTPVDLRPMVAQAYAMLPDAYRANLPLDKAMLAIEAFMATDDNRDATAKGLEIFLRSMRDGAAPIREAIYRVFNDNVGILSLSEIPDNELMLTVIQALFCVLMNNMDSLIDGVPKMTNFTSSVESSIPTDQQFRWRPLMVTHSW
jgi:hypothetical protein